MLTGTADLGGTGNALANGLTGNAGANVLNGPRATMRSPAAAAMTTFDTDGNGTADFAVKLEALTTIAAADFIL